MKRAALYARVSTDFQAREGESIMAQVEALKKYANKHHYEIAGIYIDDGVSGTLLDERDELQHLLADVKKKKIDVILVCKLDRWFRSVRHYLNTQEILDKYNVPWVAIWENYETQSPQGRLMINQMLSFAQFEAEQTGLRINKAFEYKKEKHEVLSGKVPFGYKIVDKHMVPDPEKAEIARLVFQTYIDTGSMCETMRRTQGLGLPRTQGAIRRMLDNEKYIGKAHGYDNYCEPIIDKQTFETVQHMLKMNVKKSQVRNYIFTGMIYCGECRRKMYGSSDIYKRTGTRYKTYKCMYHYRPLPDCDNRRALNERKLEEYLVKNLEDLAFADISVDGKAKVADYEKQIAAIDKKVSRLKDLYVNELISLEEYKRDLSDYKAQIDDFRSKMRKYEGSDKTALKNLVGSNLADWYWTLTTDERRTLWRSVIDKIWFDGNRKLTVEFL